MLKLTTDKHEASRGLSATAELLVQDGGRGLAILLPVFCLLMPLYSEGQNLSTNQISSTYINSWLRYNYFRFGKTNVRHIGILLWFWFQLYHRNWHAILHQADKFHPNETTYSGNMMSYWCFKMADAAAQYYFRFVFVDITAFRWSKSVTKPNSVDIFIHGCDITTSVFGK